jgi:hypothetical protein
MLTKEKVLRSLQDLPDQFSFDELMDRLFLLHKIEIGQVQSRNNQIISDEDLDKRFEKWQG